MHRALPCLFWAMEVRVLRHAPPSLPAQTRSSRPRLLVLERESIIDGKICTLGHGHSLWSSLTFTHPDIHTY